MTGLELALAALACGAGATLRWWLSTAIAPRRFALHTLTANLLGAALLGALAALVLERGFDASLLTIAGGGFAGGLTTYSTFAVDILLLWKRESVQRAVMYAVSTCVAGAAAAILGWVAAATIAVP